MKYGKVRKDINDFIKILAYTNHTITGEVTVDD